MDQHKQYNLITYVLYLAGFVFGGLTSLVAIIMNYIKRNEMRGTWLESHVNWQIKTFWMSFLGYVVGGILAFIGIGFIILLVVVIWHIYRLIKGLLALNENREIS